MFANILFYQGDDAEGAAPQAIRVGQLLIYYNVVVYNDSVFINCDK